MSKIPKVRKIHDVDLKDLVAQKAKEDNDNMQFPTHAVIKDGEIVGGWNVGQIPLLMCWHDSKKVTAKDSMIINSTVESMMSHTGVNQWWMACNSNSPYMNFFEKFGHKLIWPTNIIHKEI